MPCSLQVKPELALQAVQLDVVSVYLSTGKTSDGIDCQQGNQQGVSAEVHGSLQAVGEHLRRGIWGSDVRGVIRICGSSSLISRRWTVSPN